MSDIKFNALEMITRDLQRTVLNEIEEALVSDFKKKMEENLESYRNTVKQELAKITFNRISRIKNDLELTDELKVLIRINEEVFTEPNQGHETEI